MKVRKEVLELKDKVCFREFDASQNKFVLVSKEERDRKQALLEIQLKELEAKNKEKQAKLDLFIKQQKGGIFGINA